VREVGFEPTKTKSYPLKGYAFNHFAIHASALRHIQLQPVTRFQFWIPALSKIESILIYLVFQMEEKEYITLPSGRQIERKVYSQYTQEELKDIIQECSNIKHVITTLKIHRNYHRYLTKFITDNNIDISHFKKVEKKKAVISCLVKGDTYHSSAPIKKYLIQNNIVENKCSVCNIPPEWNNKPLTLQLDHINGDHFDNRVENLRLICPNCHTQTDTYTGRNLREYKKKECSDCQSKLKAENVTGKCAKCINKEKHLCSICKVRTKKGNWSKCSDCLEIKRKLPLCKYCKEPIKRATNISGFHHKCYKIQKEEK
jgi:hypothetical protein